MSPSFSKCYESQVQISRGFVAVSYLQATGWLVVNHRHGFWIAIDTKTAIPVEHLPIDPY